MTTKKARPGFGGTASSRRVIASRPPAEAPTPTMVKGKAGGAPSPALGSAGGVVSVMGALPAGCAFAPGVELARGKVVRGILRLVADVVATGQSAGQAIVYAGPKPYHC